ncbi:hypothetical protein F4677DRAFT_442283 [Hypoxylon crocopeplum]|nr:hypothetical protein F4677DRAFT_442283 [Hypoxylon crocopeplum]
MERQTRRRRRPALSCLECRRRKIKCDRNDPCAHCVSSKSQCTYKIYSSEPVIRQQTHPESSRSETSSPPEYAPSFLAQVTQIRTNRPTTEPRFVPAVAGSSTATLVEGQNGTPDSLGRCAIPLPEHIRRAEPEPEPEPDVRDLLRRIQRLEEFSASSPVNALSETTRDILSQQFGLQSSQIILNKTRILPWSLRMGITQEYAPMMACYIASIASVKGSSDQGTETGALHVQIGTLLQKCKNVARAIKAARPSRCLWCPDFDLAPPSREIADTMVNLYFRLFESTHRIIHVPSFWTEYQRYWDHPESVTIDLRLKVLLVIGIGSSLSEHAYTDAGFRSTVHQWTYAAQTWLSGPIEKDRLNIAGLQIHCLTMLARQVFSVGGDLVWTSMGSLIHSAMQIGLHRDPKHLPKMTVLQAEIRRRLWATVLEMVVQSSLDTAMPPRISSDEFDTLAPSNYNDDEIGESRAAPQPHPKHTYTSTSMQLLLLDSLPTRLRVLQLLNGLHSELSYVDVLALSSEITDAHRACSSFMKENEHSGVTAFHRNLFDYLVRRFLIPLHCSFASKALSNPLFYYSHKVSLDSAMAIMSPEPDQGFSRLLAIGGGMFREGIRYASTVITFELVTQVKAQHLDGTLQRNSQYIELLKKTVRDMISLFAERIRQGETNVKSHMFVSMILAQAEAMEAGIPCELKIAQSTKDSLELCYELIKARAGGASPYPSDAGLTPMGLDGGLDGYGLDLDMDFFWPDAGFS